MADAKISALQPAQSVAGDEEILEVKNGIDVRVTPQQLADFIRNGLAAVARTGQYTDLAGVPPGALSVSGGTALGSTLTATLLTQVAGVEIGPQWTRDGADIPGATAWTYTVSSADMGLHLYCRPVILGIAIPNTAPSLTAMLAALFSQGTL